MSGTKCILVLVSVLLIASSEASYRIINGKPTKINKYPYVVAIYSYLKFVCSGVLITTSTVLTAAHCGEYPIASLGIKAGITDQCERGVFAKVMDIKFHPKYNHSDYFAGYDVAVFFLDRNISSSNVTKTAKLPTSEDRPKSTWVGTVIGWGALDLEATKYPSQLQKAQVPVTKLKKCKEWYQKRHRKLGTTNFCVGYLNGTNKGVSRGDHGGPFVYNRTVYGVMTFRRNQPAPGVYISVRKVVKFIKDTAGL